MRRLCAGPLTRTGPLRLPKPRNSNRVALLAKRAMHLPRGGFAPTRAKLARKIGRTPANGVGVVMTITAVAAATGAIVAIPVAVDQARDIYVKGKEEGRWCGPMVAEMSATAVWTVGKGAVCTATTWPYFMLKQV